MVRGFSAALARSGADVTILTTDSNGDRGQPPLDVPLDHPVVQDGYQVRYFRCSPFRRYKFSLPLLRWLWHNADRFDIAHIHALFSPVSSGAAWVCRSRGLPYILRPLGTLDPADLRKKAKLKQLYVAAIEGQNIAKAAALHFTAADEAKVSQRFGATTPDVILPLGVDPIVSQADQAAQETLAQWGIAPDRPVLLFMSRIEPKKGLDLLIPALEQLVAAGETFQFVLAGANPQDPAFERQIQQQIARSPLADRTIITGFVTGAMKAALLQRADLFLLPSYYENFGIAVAEALVAGVPVLISDRVQIWDTIQAEGAGWVVPCATGAIVTAIREALHHPDERHARGQRARRCALTHYSWDAIAQATLQVYQKIGSKAPFL